MSKIQLVIEIDEEIYSKIVNIYEYSFITLKKEQLERLDGAIRRGIPLPKGHGRIIDENKIEVCEWVDVLEESYPKASTDAPTIIEADKGGKDEISD